MKIKQNIIDGALTEFMFSMKGRFNELQKIRDAKQELESKMKAEYTHLRNTRKYRNMPKTQEESQLRLTGFNNYLRILEQSVIVRCNEQYRILTEKLKGYDSFLTEFEIIVNFYFCGPYMEDAPRNGSYYGYSSEMVAEIDNIDGNEIALGKSTMQSYNPTQQFEIENECWLYSMLYEHCKLNTHAILSINGIGADVVVKMINRYEYLNHTWAKLSLCTDNETF